MRIGIGSALVVSLCGLAPAASAQLDAAFSVDVVSGVNPLTVQFSDLTTGGTPSGWLWDFGDGGGSTLASPSHTYTAPGTYSVKLTVLEGLFSSDVELKADLISVSPASFAGGFEVDVTAGTLPLAVQFTDSSSGPVDGWLWDFGDGATSTEQHPVHSYTAPGSYSVSLTPAVGAQTGAAVEQRDLISVAPAALDTAISVSSTSVAGETLISFHRGQGGVVPHQVRWTLGDGSELLGEDAERVLVPQEPGGLDVTVTATYYGQEASATASQLISTAPGPFGRLRRLEALGVSEVAGGDLDQDGDSDLVALRTPTGFTSELVSYRNLGGGQFDPGQALGSQAFVYRSLLVADLDGDGPLDVLAGRGTGALLLPGLGNGGFAGSLYLPDLGADDLAGGDLDLDGDLDLAVVRSAGRLDWFANDGAAQFTFGATLTLTTGDTVEQVVCADMDADGDVDVLANDRDVFARYWRNLDGVGADWQRVTMANTAGTGLAVADMDGDGDLDLAVPGWLESTATWVPFQGGMPGPAVAYPAQGLNYGAFAAADIDGDGDTDLLRGQTGHAGTGPLAPAALVAWDAGPQAPRGVASALDVLSELVLLDLDDDGRLDLLMAGPDGLGWQPGQALAGWSSDVDPGLAGTGGGVPRLDTFGTLAPQELVTLALSGALAGSTTFLVLGSSALAAPFKGGVLTPFPELVLPLPLGGNGHLVLHATWPGSIPAGVPVYAQHWVIDGGGPVGFAASQGVVGFSQD